MEPKERYNNLLAQKVIEELGKRNIEGFYCETREAAREKALALMSKGSVVSRGGSLTLQEIGLQDALKGGDYNFLDPDDGKTGAEKAEIARRALGADFFLMSCNAISITGELVNADGIGNRVAALAFGPKNVIIVAGVNKVEPNLDAAILRVKTHAAQLGVVAYKPDCGSFDELSEAAESTWKHLVVTSGSVFPGRIKVILVGESLGF